VLRRYVRVNRPHTSGCIQRFHHPNTPVNTRQICLALILTAAAFRADGGLVISEVLYNEVGSDAMGEWIEIFNNGSTLINLTDFKIGDEETSGGTTATETIVRFPAGATIAPGEIQIVAVSATVFNTVYGFLPTYEVNATNGSVPDMLPYLTWDPDGGVINMSNTTDQALILNGSDLLVDAVNWGNTTFLNPGLADAEADGQSYQRINAFTDTDTAGDWALASPSTPGVIPEPGSLALSLMGAFVFGAARRRRK
jgi:Lamin Tail Domain/PEP-CTERM motif